MATTIRNTGVLFNNATTQRRAFPSDGIIWWYGDILNIPSGWKLCDGTNGTPDLRGRMVVGAGGAYAVGATGGSATVTLTLSNLPVHTHSLTGTLAAGGGHAHGVTISTDGNHDHLFSPGSIIGQAPGNPFGPGPTRLGSASFGNAGAHGHTAPNSAPAGTHSHPITISIAPAGSGAAHQNMPPYYALVYLQAE